MVYFIKELTLTVVICSSIVLFFLINLYSVNETKVLIISFDGLRHDYLKIAERQNINIEHFKHFSEDGVHPTHIVPVFPTFTSPNHWSLLTGLYPHLHGVVDNEYYDRELDDIYKDSYRMDSKWFDKLDLNPLWLVNQRHGYMSSSFMWPTTAVKIRGETPRFVYGIDNFHDLPSVEYRIDKILDWLTVSDKTNLGFLYFPEPDLEGHLTGPASESMLKKIVYLNHGLGYLRNRLKALKLNDLNIVFWSDHGMTHTGPDKEIYLNKLLSNASDAFLVGASIWPSEGKLEQVYNDLKKNEKNYRVYRNEAPPSDLLYGHHQRIGPLFVVTELGYYFLPNETMTLKNASPDKILLGYHGNEIKHADMWPYFMAWGPAFKKNYIPQEPPHTVDIFLMVCTILHLHNCPPTNGSIDRINDLLSTPDCWSTNKIYLNLLTLFIFFLITGSAALLYCSKYGRKTKKMI